MYYLHRIEDEQDYSEHYYSSPKIKELKKDIQKLHTSNLAVLQVIDDIKEQIGLRPTNQKYRSSNYYISDFKIFSDDYLDLFVKELIDKKKQVKSELLIDVFESLIKSYSDYEWRKL